MTTTDTPAATPAPTLTTHRVARWRRILCAVLVVLSCVLAPLSGVAIWTRNQLLDTSRYVDNVTPLASNPAILDAAATQATAALFREVDVKKEAENALPQRAQFLAGPLASALEQFATQAVRKGLESQQFRDVWVAANRRAHTQIENALTGGGKVISTRNGKIVLDLSAILLNLRKLLDDRGITVFDSIPINKLALKFQLFDASALDQAQSGVDLLNKLAYILPILLFVFLGLAIWLSPHRRRTIIRWGIGVTIAAAVVAVAVAVGRSFYLDAVASPSFPRDALAATWDTLIRFLRDGLRAMMAIGLIVAFVTWIFGPGRNATRLRNTVGGMGDKAEARGLDFGGFGRFVHRYHRALQIAGVIVVFTVLVLGNRVSAARLVWSVVIVLVWLAAVEFVSRAAKIEGEPTPGDA